MALKAVDRVHYYSSILLSLLNVRVLLLEELLFLNTKALLYLYLPSLKAPLSPLSLSSNNKVLNILLFSKEGLDNILLLRATLGLPR